MPFKSMKQSRYFFANPEKLGGIDKVMEWAHKTNYNAIPNRVTHPKPKSHMRPLPRRTNS
jgi:hypothetical protein